MYLATLEVLGWRGGQRSLPAKSWKIPFSPWRALLEGGRCFQMVCAGLLPSSGTLRCMHYPQLHTRIAGTFLCQLRALPLPSEVFFDEHRGVMWLPAFSLGVGWLGAAAALPEGTCEMQVIRVMWLLCISQSSLLLKCFLWPGTGCQFKRGLKKSICSGIDLWPCTPPFPSQGLSHCRPLRPFLE